MQCLNNSHIKRKNTGYGSSSSSSRGGKKKWSRGEKASDPSSCPNLGSIILSGSHNTWIGKYSSLSFFLACRFKDSSCSRRRSLCGLPVGEVHRQVGFYFACLLLVVILCPTTTCAGLATGDTEVVGDTGTTTGGGNRTGCCAGERTFFCSPFQVVINRNTQEFSCSPF